MRVRWRHEVIGLRRLNALDDAALIGIAGNNRLVVERCFAHIKPEVSLPVILIWPVTGVAVFRQNGANVSIEGKGTLAEHELRECSQTQLE